MIDPIPIDSIAPSPYLSLEDSLKEFNIAPGYVIEPVASGKDVHLCIALSFDGNGRAWSCEMRSYMPDIDGNGEQTPNGQIRVLEDTDNDGQIDKTTLFLDGLVLPRAVAVTSDGCLYTSGKILYFIKREGLKPVGEPIIVDKDYAIGGNPEHNANGLLYGHDNWYYNAKGKSRYRRIKGKWIKEKTRIRGQWGISKDNAGHLYYNANSVLLIGDIFPPMFLRGNPHYKPKASISPRLGTNATHPAHITPGVNRAYQKGILDENGKLQNATAACGLTIYRGDNFPADKQNTAFICEPAGDLIKAIKVTRDEHNFPNGHHSYGDKEFLTSTDEWFLPCNLYTAPDGTLWMVDMYFGLLQHRAYMTSYLRKQYESRKLDQPGPSTGRIYRIRYGTKNLSPVPRMDGLPASELVQFLSHPNGTIRDIAQRLIVESGDLSIVDTLTNLVTEKSSPWGQIHALWTLDGLGATNTKALLHGLKSDATEVINNTLHIIAQNRINEPKIQAGITQLKDNQQILHARVRAMAAAGLEEQALKLTVKAARQPHFLHQAFVSGLGIQVPTFRKAHPKIPDDKLDKLITNATKATQKTNIAKTPPGHHLKGDDKRSFQRGKNIYTTKAACFGCHGDDGKGLDNLGPPLDKSEWVTENPSRLIKILLHGMAGPLTVNGEKYNPALVMPGLKDNKAITDQDLADVINYIRNSWTNKTKLIGADLVEKVRKDTSDQAEPYQAKDLEQ